MMGTAFAASERIDPKRYPFDSSMFGRAVLQDRPSLERLASRLRAGEEPQASAFKAVLSEAEAAMARDPAPPRSFHVPFRYLDKEGHYRGKAALQRDSNGAYALALAYRMTGEERFAGQAVAILDAWSTGVRRLSKFGDSKLAFSYHFPAMIFAGDLLGEYPGWSSASRARFARFLREKALRMHTMARSNNWGSWGVVLQLAIAAHTGDLDGFARGIQRWADLIGTQIADDGHLPHEVERSGGRRGLWYTHFCLFPQTLAAEIAKVNGIDLFDFVSRKGRTLLSAFELAARWTRRPETFPYYRGDPSELTGVRAVSYFEILNARWPQPEIEELLRTIRPLNDSHSGAFMTFTHGIMGRWRSSGGYDREKPF